MLAGGALGAAAHVAPPTSATCTVYPLSAYFFGNNGAQGADQAHNAEERAARARAEYAKEGPRRAVDAVLLAMRHNVPHVLLLRDGSGFCRLPGGKLKPGEGAAEGLKRKLSETLSPPADSPIQGPVWVPGTPIGTLWRPSFDSPLFPYKPAHVTEPKETRTVYLVPLPETAYFAPPANLEVIVVPLHELYDNTARFGPLIAAVPVMLSSVQLNVVQSVEKAEA